MSRRGKVVKVWFTVLSLVFLAGCLEEVKIDITYQPTKPVVNQVIFFSFDGNFPAPMARTEVEIYYKGENGEERVYENNNFSWTEKLSFTPEDIGWFRISVSAADKMLNYGTKTISFEVVGSPQQNTAPEVSITSHVDDQVIEPGVQTVVGSAWDKEDGELSEYIEWLIDGQLEGIGSSIVFSFDQLKNYEVVAEVTDADLATEQAKVVLIVKDLVPKINLTYVSPYGDEKGYLEGQITGVARPTDWIIIVYIKVHEVYWLKPYLTSPYLVPDENGFFEGDITTGGQDECATEVVVMLALAGTEPELCHPCYELPAIAGVVDQEIVERGPAEVVINFAGQKWLVKYGDCRMGPGDNFFFKENVELINNELHLKIASVDGQMGCAEVVCQKSFGLGTYRVITKGRLDQYEPWTVAAPLFTWETAAYDDAYREIDVEIAKWGSQNNSTNAQFVVQPCSQCPGCGDNCSRFVIDQTGQSGDYLTFIMVWQEEQVTWRCYKGRHPSGTPPQEDLIHQWIKQGGTPEPGQENPRINIWNFQGQAPSQEQELVVSDFNWQADYLVFPECGNQVIDPGEDCDPPGPCCTENCTYAPEGTSCADQQFCNGQETCDGSGLCLDGEPVNCQDKVACTDDFCDEEKNQCQSIPNDDNCPSNGLFCDGTEYCDQVLGCLSTGDPCADDEVCNEDTDTCDTASGECGLIITKVESGYAYGTAFCYEPSEYVVVVYILVRGGWWTKPYWAWPSTEIAIDHTWRCDIITGGVDQEATKVAAFLVPKDFEIPLRSGQSELPQEIIDNALDSDMFEI